MGLSERVCASVYACVCSHAGIPGRNANGMTVGCWRSQFFWIPRKRKKGERPSPPLGGLLSILGRSETAVRCRSVCDISVSCLSMVQAISSRVSTMSSRAVTMSTIGSVSSGISNGDGRSSNIA